MAGESVPPSERPDGAIFAPLFARFIQHEALGERLVAIAGLAAFLAGTLPDLQPHDGALTLICLGVAALFAIQYALRLRRAASWRAAALSGRAMIDLLAAAPLPLALLFGVPAETARLFGVFWSLKLVRLNPALRLLGRVLQNEGQSLASVAMAFVVIMLFAGTAGFIAEHDSQPEAFGSIPAALWWAVTTITTTGYGDKVPLSFAGRLLGGIVMVSGIGLFALWAGILASGFAQELRRREFLQSWDLVSRLPLFRGLGAPALSDITRLLKVERCPTGAFVVRKGQPGDSMYFIAEGDVEVRTQSARIRLGPGQFFGEMALVRGEPRNASVVALTPARLLRLDVVDFLGLAADQPELLQIIKAESERRAVANPA
jgi:voltage-gated potassium channel